MTAVTSKSRWSNWNTSLHSMNKQVTLANTAMLEQLRSQPDHGRD